MRRTLIATCAASLLVASPMVALPVAAQSFLDNITNEDIGRVLGGVGGAVVGSQIGSGTGQMVAVAAGALGGLFLGGEIGKHLDGRDQAKIAETRQQALDTGQPVSWQNPDTGTSSTARVTETVYRPAPSAAVSGSGGGGSGDDAAGAGVAWRVPTMQLIGRDHVATTRSNVRGGPGTNFAIMTQIDEGERVHVVGKATEANWYMIARNGIGRGFVHADLLDPASGSATAMQRPASTADFGARECSLLEQEVRLADGTSETRHARACRMADGSWKLV